MTDLPPLYWDANPVIVEIVIGCSLATLLLKDAGMMKDECRRMRCQYQRAISAIPHITCMDDAYLRWGRGWCWRTGTA